MVDGGAEHAGLASACGPDDGDQGIGARGERGSVRLWRIETGSLIKARRGPGSGPALVGPVGDGELLVEDLLCRVAAAEHGLSRGTAVGGAERSHAGRGEVDAVVVEDALGEAFQPLDELARRHMHRGRDCPRQLPQEVVRSPRRLVLAEGSNRLVDHRHLHFCGEAAGGGESPDDLADNSLWVEADSRVTVLRQRSTG